MSNNSLPAKEKPINYRRAWVDSCPDVFAQAYSHISGFSKRYFKEVSRGSPVTIKNGAFFHEDYQSRLVNIVDGMRCTTDIPLHYEQTIFLLGPSFTYGSYCEDKDTLGSNLQRICNDKFPSRYIIKNYATRGLQLEFFILQIGTLNINKGDIVILVMNEDIIPGAHDVEPWQFVVRLQKECMKLGAEFAFFLYPRLREIINPSPLESIQQSTSYRELYEGIINNDFS